MEGKMMRDMPKLVIVGSTAVLVLGAVMLMLFMTGGKEQQKNDNEQDKSDGHKEISRPPDDGGGPPPDGHLPDVLALPATLQLPCSATLKEIAAKYYLSIKLHNGDIVPIPASAHGDIAKRLSKYNDGIDPAAALPAGTTVKLPRIYIVQGGDNLSKISSKLYGGIGRVDDIFSRNSDIIRDRNAIGRGWALILPE